MSQYLKQKVETLKDVSRRDFMEAMMDKEFNKDFDIDFDGKILDASGMIVIPKDQREVNATVSFHDKNHKAHVGLVFNDDYSVEVRGDFYGSGTNIKQFSEKLGMIYNSYKVVKAARSAGYMVNIIAQSNQEIKLECLA